MRPVRAVSVLRLTGTGLDAGLCVEVFELVVVSWVWSLKMGVVWISDLVIEGCSYEILRVGCLFDAYLTYSLI